MSDIIDGVGRFDVKISDIIDDVVDCVFKRDEFIDAPLCTQKQSTDATYAVDLSILVVLQFIHHTSQVHVNLDFRYIP